MSGELLQCVMAVLLCCIFLVVTVASYWLLVWLGCLMSGELLPCGGRCIVLCSVFLVVIMTSYWLLI